MTTERPWMDTSLSADERADLLIAQLTLDEMISLVHGPMPALLKERPADAELGAGYIPGVPRLGIPALNESDASLGIGGDIGRPHCDAGCQCNQEAASAELMHRIRRSAFIRT